MFILGLQMETNMEHETEPTIRGLGYWAILAGVGSQNGGGGAAAQGLLGYKGLSGAP